MGKLFEHLRDRSTSPRDVDLSLRCSKSFPRFEALEVLATHDMGHSRMKLCCADATIVLSEMRTRMEWASDEYCVLCIAQALKTWTKDQLYVSWRFII